MNLRDRPLHGAAALLFVVALLEVGRFHLLEGLEGRVSDYFVRHHASGLAPDPDIVIVDIDDLSLDRMQDAAGKFPWPRSVYAELVQGIESQNPRAIVFDILFSEGDARDPEFDRVSRGRSSTRSRGSDPWSACRSTSPRSRSASCTWTA